MDDPLDQFFDVLKSRRPNPNPRPGDDTRAASSARQTCREYGHRYQVHGKDNPYKLACSRCRVTWAVGARTEPS